MTKLPGPGYVELIAKKARFQVDQYLRGIESDETPTLEAKQVIEGIIAADYRGRAVIEMIQNAHDANSKEERTGRIAVLLDETEGEHGVLYVANTGEPLGHNNFKAMLDVGISSKAPNEGIGNKGVGFKSVLEFSICPEVYSKATLSSTQFDGYSFRFARDDDFHDLAKQFGRPEIAEDLRDNISTLKLPIALSELPDRIERLGETGYCTVIRLPLRSSKAALAAALQLICSAFVSRGQAKAASAMASQGPPSVVRRRALQSVSVSWSTRGQADMRGLDTAGRAVRLGRGRCLGSSVATGGCS